MASAKNSITKRGHKFGKGDKIVRTPAEQAEYINRKNKAFAVRKFFRLHSVAVITAGGAKVSVYEAAKLMQVNVRRVMNYVYDKYNEKTDNSFIEIPYTDISFRREVKEVTWLCHDGLDVSVVKSAMKPTNGIAIVRGLTSYSNDGVTYTKVSKRVRKAKK